MACVASLLTASELSELSLLTSAWRYEAWLHAYPLNRATVLDYFKHSPFYSLHANNERINAAIAAASQLPQPPQPPQPHAQPAQTATAASQSSSSVSSSAALRHMEGLEYALDGPPTDAAAQQSYFVLRQQWRLSPSMVHLLAVYYVVAAVEQSPSQSAASSLPVGSVIPMPRFHSLAQCALDSSAATLTAAILAITRMHSRRRQRQLEQADDESRDDGRGEVSEGTEAQQSARNELGGQGRTRDVSSVSLVPSSDDSDSAGIARPLYAQMAADAIRLTNVSEE